MSLPVGLVAALTLFGLHCDVYQASVNGRLVVARRARRADERRVAVDAVAARSTRARRRRCCPTVAVVPRSMPATLSWTSHGTFEATPPRVRVRRRVVARDRRRSRPSPSSRRASGRPWSGSSTGRRSSGCTASSAAGPARSGCRRGCRPGSGGRAGRRSARRRPPGSSSGFRRCPVVTVASYAARHRGAASRTRPS